MTTKNDDAWAKIFAKSPEIMQAIEANAYCDIDANTIKEFREPRLACKIDHREHTPKPLKEKGLSVLAIKNGLYRVARTDPFVDIRLTNAAPKIHSLPKHLEALAPDSIKSESKALDAALLSGMLADLIDDKLALVLRGREFSKPFEFSLPNQHNPQHKIDYAIDGVILEVDGGYEGRKGLYLIEAKIGKNSNMNLRQLLYPHIHYREKFHKVVKSYVMFYQPDTGYFHFLPFNPTTLQFDIHGGHRCYQLEDLFPKRKYWEQIASLDVDMERTDCEAPFPQADNFGRVLTAFLKLSEHEGEGLTKEELFATHDFRTPRQFDYYINVLRWMRLAQKVRSKQQGVMYGLSELGIRIGEMSIPEMLFEMAKIAFSNNLFNQFLQQDRPHIPSHIREENGLCKEKTFKRRVQTVQAWKKYFQQTLTQ